MRVREHSYYLDKEGFIYLDGSEVEDPGFYNLVHRSLQRTEDGRFMAVCQGERCYFQVEDVPYVVIDLEIVRTSEARSRKPDGGLERVSLLFRGDYREALDPTTLCVGKCNVLYCRVRNGSFEARFNRKAYYDLASHIQHDPWSDEFYLMIESQKYSIGIKS